MAGNEDQSNLSLAPPAVSALRQKTAGGRIPIERTASMDIRAEREDLKEAAEQSLNVVLNLGLDGIIQWVSPSWKDLVGTTPESMKGKYIADILVSRKDAFADAVESMKKDDSRSQFIRFQVQMGPFSVLKKDNQEVDVDVEEPIPQEERVEEERVLNIEGQGIMVYDRLSGGESHTMWMLRLSAEPKEITIDLPEILVESLGVGAEMLAHYLTSLAEVGANDPANHPPPLPVLCRICERQITPWWFEKHSELCLQEYRAEMEVQLAQEALTDHRNAIVKVLDALEARKGRSGSVEPANGPIPQPEYKGMLIGPPSQTSSGSDSGRASPATPPRSRDTSTSGIGHSRTRSFAVRRPLSRIVELILDLCDTAMEINIPTIKPSQPSDDGIIRTQSPQSESRIAQVRSWQTPGANSLDQEQGLAALSADTESFSLAKVDAVERHRDTIEYSERIRVEYDTLVIECIDAAMKKAASIAAGQLSDSTEGDQDEDELETPAAHAPSFFNDAYDGASALSAGLRTASDTALSSQADERRSSIARSSRSDSPMECPTPKSHTQSFSMVSRSQSVGKRASLYMSSDAGDSDNNLASSVNVEVPRTVSPASERVLGRSSSSADRKRRSLRLRNVPSPHRQPSPGRANGPSSPLRSTKPRLSMALEGFPSPIASPPLSGTEHSSPIIQSHRHRRQSSAASSTIDLHKAPPSPRLAALAHPQAKAVPTSIKDFEIIKPISKGAFGSVYLSKKKSTGDYFAIKVLKKADMVAKNQISNVKAERAIMMWQGESDFVAKLYWTFSSKDFLYLVMEYLNGGDCASLVKVLGGLSEDWAKKYLAEVVLGVEHLHSRGIVHRDLKPDNLLIDQKGHLKLTDFGLSRMGLIGRQKRYLKSPNESTPDLLKQGPFARATSMASSRSTSFDLQGNHSPASTPIMTPDLAISLGQPSYFSLNREYKLGREHSRRKSGYRSDSGNSDTFNIMFRNFSLNDDASQRGAPIEEETHDEGAESPDLYALQPTTSNVSNVSQSQHHTPPPISGMLPPPMALFDPDDHNRRFVGTPDYLAPETINGLGQDEMSDWWSLGCIMFEFLYGYPPFHADSPEKVFENILARKVDWPNETECAVSTEARDLMERLMTINPKERLGANMAEQHSSGGHEIRQHPWFQEINWETLLQDEAQFVPAPSNPEDTEYFDDRGATLQAFAEEMEDQASSPAATPNADYPDRPHDALSRVRNQVNSMKRGLMPLHIPAHVRDGRSRRLSEPVQTDDFGNFTFKNLPVLEKANKEVLQKLRTEAQMQGKSPVAVQSPVSTSTGPSLEKSPLLPMPLKRALSQNRGSHRPSSPSGTNQPNPSPNRASNPSSPLLVSFSTGQNHERRKTSSTSSSFSHQSSQSLQPGSFFDVPRLPTSQSTTSNTSSPVKTNRLSMNIAVPSPERNSLAPRPQSIASTSRARSQTVGSQEGDNSLPPSKALGHYKRRSQVFDVSPSSSDNEDPRTKALLRVQRRRQSSRRMSQIMLGDGPSFRPLDVLICEDHPVSRLVMERLLEKLRCRTITVVNGPEAVRYAMSEVQFDIIMMEYKLPQINGADVARMVRDTKSANTQTPIIAVTGYLKELPQTHHFDSLIEKPPTLTKLTDALCNLCQWKPPPPGYTPQPQPKPPSALRQESKHAEDSPSSQSSGPFARLIGSRPSREHSIGSSFFGDTDSTNTEDIPAIIREPSNEWHNHGLGIQAPDNKPFIHPGLPHLLHQNSAPPAFDQRTPRRQRSADAVKAKRADLEKNRHECAESGDDEDEELGDVQVRARSPQNKSRGNGGGSKLSVEMMRTNSRGSVTSVPDDPKHMNQTLPTVPSTTALDTSTIPAASAIEPPEIFPKDAAGDAQKIIDMDATPRPLNLSAIPQKSPTDLREQSFLASPSPTRETH